MAFGTGAGTGCAGGFGNWGFILFLILILLVFGAGIWI